MAGVAKAGASHWTDYLARLPCDRPGAVNQRNHRLQRERAPLMVSQEMENKKRVSSAKGSKERVQSVTVGGVSARWRTQGGYWLWRILSVWCIKQVYRARQTEVQHSYVESRV